MACALPLSVLHLMTPGLHQTILTNRPGTLPLHHRVLLFLGGVNKKCSSYEPSHLI